MGIAPSLLAPDAIASRDALAKLLTAYYTAKLDQRSDVSAIIQQRAALSRKAGFDDADLGAQELLIPWVATTNTIPTFFWLFSVVFSNPEYASRVRAEAVALASIADSPGGGGRLAELPVGQLETRCPFLHACYQEVLRLYLNGVGNRRVMRDTRLHDADGRPYLLKEGVNVQVPSGVLHTLGSAWGPDAGVFRPERWLDASPQQERSRRGAFMPFGGGRHLCPGRRFARGEILGFMAVVAAGFEVEGVELPRSTDPSIGTLSRPPVWESTRRGVTIRRREDWEDVTWTFIS
jgi:cytochrome P450